MAMTTPGVRAALHIVKGCRIVGICLDSCHHCRLGILLQLRKCNLLDLMLVELRGLASKLSLETTTEGEDLAQRVQKESMTKSCFTLYEIKAHFLFLWTRGALSKTVLLW